MGLVFHKMATGWHLEKAKAGKQSGLSLQTLIFHRDDIKKCLSWKHSREFEWNGVMYDVVKKQECGDEVIFTCVADHKETILLYKIKEHLGFYFLSHHEQKETPSKDLKGPNFNFFIHPEIILVLDCIVMRINPEGKPFYCADFLKSYFHPPEYGLTV